MVTANRNEGEFFYSDVDDDKKNLNMLLYYQVKDEYDYYGEWLHETVNSIERNDKA